jgi:hypothetical protein
MKLFHAGVGVMSGWDLEFRFVNESNMCRAIERI